MHGEHPESVRQLLRRLLRVAATTEGLREVGHGRVGDAGVGGGDGGGEVQFEVDEAAGARDVQVVSAKLLALLRIPRSGSLSWAFYSKLNFARMSTPA